MRNVFMVLASIVIVAMTAGAASAQCQGGVCGFGVRQAPRSAGRVVVRSTVRVKERAGGAIRSTRLFDGDGRPLRKAG